MSLRALALRRGGDGAGAFTDLFIRRPVLAVVVALLILVAGVQAILSLTVRQYPRSDNASVTVSTVYIAPVPNWSADSSPPRSSAPWPADGIDYIESQSSQAAR